MRVTFCAVSRSRSKAWSHYTEYVSFMSAILLSPMNFFISSDSILQKLQCLWTLLSSYLLTTALWGEQFSHTGLLHLLHWCSLVNMENSFRQRVQFLALPRSEENFTVLINCNLIGFFLDINFYLYGIIMLLLLLE